MSHDDARAATARKPRRLRRWLGYAVLTAVVLAFALLLFQVLLDMPKEDVAELAVNVRTFKEFGVLVQVGLVVWIAVAWRHIVDAGVWRRIVARHEYEKVLGMRWTVFAFLVGYLLLVPIGPTTMYRFLTQ